MDYKKLAASALMALITVACGVDDMEPNARTVEKRLSVEQNRVLGFETPVADWTTTNGSTTSATTDANEGAAALSIVPNGYTQIESAAIDAPGSARAIATLDVKLPQALVWGDARLVMRIPSQGLWWVDLGGNNLAGLAGGVFHTLSFHVPQQVQDALSSPATDVSFVVILNAPNGTGPFTIDNLVVSDDDSSNDDSATAAETLTLSVPRGVAVGDVLMSGTNVLTIDDRSTLGQNDELINISGLGSATSELGAGVEIHANLSSVGDVDFLRSSSHVYGSVTTNGVIREQNDVVIDGGRFEGANIESATTTWTVDWPAGVTEDISLPPDAPNVPVAPGAYDSIQVFSRATFTLRSGTYYINSLVVEPDANFQVDTSAGPVQIYVRDTLRLNVGLHYIAGERGQALFGYLGDQAALFQEAIVATVVAPSSPIELRRPNSGLPHEGQFFGRDVHVFSDATVLHLPYKFSFLCPSGDYDKDGVFNCFEVCWNDPGKTGPGICGCGVPDTNRDGDVLPDCKDQCPDDPLNTYRGQCGCDGELDTPAAGTFCTDSLSQGPSTCDGHGKCGDDDLPETDCFPVPIGTRVYYFCRTTGPGLTRDEAAALCDQSPGRHLARIDDPEENADIAAFVQGPAWVGGNDWTVEGEWFWMDAKLADDVQFWTGGDDGGRFRGRYNNWAGGRPVTDDALDCVTISPDGLWRAADCSTSRQYVCEGTYGSSRDPGPGGEDRQALDMCDIIPFCGPTGNGRGTSSVSNIPDEDCVPIPVALSDPGALANWRAEGEDDNNVCNELCGPDVDEDDRASESFCESTQCEGAATVPPADETCTDTGEPLTELDIIQPFHSDGETPTCQAGDPGVNELDEILALQDCSDVTIAGKETRCGSKTRCLALDTEFEPIPCHSSCECDDTTGFCIDPNAKTACDWKVGDECVGRCTAVVGCGLEYEELLPFFFPQDDDDDRCDETRFCPVRPIFDEPLDQGAFPNKQIDEESLEDHHEEPEPDYAQDFDSPRCSPVNPCLVCFGHAEGDPPEELEECMRQDRHAWCTNDPKKQTFDQDESISDDGQGARGNGDSIIRVDVDPIAQMDFSLDPLSGGAADFGLIAAAGIDASAQFDLNFVSGSIDIFKVRAQLEADLCGAATDASRMEVLGIDFLPKVPDADKFLFNTDELGNDDFSRESCEDAVDEYIDAFDRAKKALRDAQELITQYKALPEGTTFDENFCEIFAGEGKRPAGMLGDCDNEEPYQTVNRFIEYYQQDQIDNLLAKIDNLSRKALDSSKLQGLIPGSQRANDDYGFYAPLLDVRGKESVTIISLQFFIGPIPAFLDVTAYMEYGIDGGLGANLNPGRLIGNGGRFAEVGAVATPYANSGVTLFVGAGFNLGVLELKVGIEGGVTLARVRLPATVSAGLSMIPVEDDQREIPMDLQDVSDLGLAFPTSGAREKFGFHFDYRYGVDLRLTDMLSGQIDGALKVKFFFFSKKFSQKLAEFDTGLEFTEPLIAGGSDERKVADDEPIWQYSFESIPLVNLDYLSAPPSDVVANQPFDTAKVDELFYDTLCTCVEEGGDCFRDDDCCDDLDCAGTSGTDGGSTCGGQCENPSSCDEANPCCSGYSCESGQCQIIVVVK